MRHDPPHCRSCSFSELEFVLSLGKTPLADRLLTEKMLSRPELRYPLTVNFCPRCSLMQIAETVSPEKLYCDDYPYYSSFSDALLRHTRENAETLIASRSLGAKSLVVELASNDGYMLRNFVERGIPVLGIDPAEGPARSAGEAGVETLCEFFSKDLAEKLRSERGAADVIIANNVLAHVPDLNGFVSGIEVLLKKTGVVVIERVSFRTVTSSFDVRSFGATGLPVSFPFTVSVAMSASSTLVTCLAAISAVTT